ncbi:aldo/keto reductase [Virgibacillus sp. NKC19-16]|nr:aldo/keto reductase [Virgibacillus sp. NKC19-16]
MSISSKIFSSKKYNANVFQILLAWCVRNGNTIAISQFSNAEHVINKVKAANIKLTEEDLAKIDAVYPEPSVSYEQIESMLTN